MAASFGVWEVKFPSSRAVYDEEEEEDEESFVLEEYSKAFTFQWAPHLVESSQTPSRECPLLVVALGDVATTFIEAHFLAAGNEIMACMTSRKENEINFEKLCSAKKSADTSCLHRLTTSGHEESVLCQCRTPVPQEKAFHWTEKVLQKFHRSPLVIILMKHVLTPGVGEGDFHMKGAGCLSSRLGV